MRGGDNDGDGDGNAVVMALSRWRQVENNYSVLRKKYQQFKQDTEADNSMASPSASPPVKSPITVAQEFDSIFCALIGKDPSENEIELANKQVDKMRKQVQSSNELAGILLEIVSQNHHHFGRDKQWLSPIEANPQAVWL